MIRTKPRFRMLPGGIYVLTVARRPKLDTARDYEFYVFDFDAVAANGAHYDFRDFFFPNEDRLRQVLFALGGVEDADGEVQIDEDEVLGMTFTAELKQVKIKGKDRVRIERVIEPEGEAKDNEPPF